MTVLILFLLLFLFMFIGVPIAISLGLSGALTILLFSPDSVRSLAIKLFETSEAYTLLAIPFFLLSGAFMTTGGVARRLIDFANACVGHIRAPAIRAPSARGSSATPGPWASSSRHRS